MAPVTGAPPPFIDSFRSGSKEIMRITSGSHTHTTTVHDNMGWLIAIILKDSSDNPILPQKM